MSKKQGTRRRKRPTISAAEVRQGSWSLMALSATLSVILALANPSRGTYVPHWAVPVAMGGVLAGLLVMTATVVFPSFALWREDPLAPDIVLAACRTVRRPFSALIDGQRVLLGWGRYTYAVFENRGTARAPSVAAQLTFMDASGMQLFGPIVGRWSGTASVSELGGNRAELNEMGMSPNHIGHGLDVAFRYEDRGDLYAHNNESQELAPDDWQWSDFRLHYDEQPYPQVFLVLVELLEEPSVHTSFWLRLTDNGLGQNPVLEQVDDGVVTPPGAATQDPSSSR